MIIAIDTSEMICRTTLINGDTHFVDEWHVGRQLADQLIGHLRGLLHHHHATWKDLTGIVVFRGPGSFTGLRIGLTVMNTLSETLAIPIIGAEGEDWLTTGLQRLDAGENDQLVLPMYGRDAHITTQRK